MNGIGLLVDIFFVLAAIIIIVVSTKRGFIKNVIRLISFILAVVLSVAFCPYLADIISEKWLDEKIGDMVYEQVASLAQREGGESYDIASLFDSEQQDFMELLERFGVDTEKLAENFKAISEGTESTVRELADKVSDSIVSGLSNILAFLAIFIVLSIVFGIIAWILELVARLPVLKQLNGILGFVCGVVLAIGFVLVFSTVALYLFDKLAVLFPETIPADLASESFILSNFSNIESVKDLLLE